MALSDQLRRAIAASGISGNALAKESGVSQSVISRFVAGNDIKFAVADKLAAYFGLELQPAPTKKPAKKKPAK